jgi:ABC-type Fe2+-enterobactin transport system substrate-binding protein
MRRTTAAGTITGTALAIAAAVVPALPAAAATSHVTTVEGVVTAVSAARHSFTLHRAGGGSLTVAVPSPDLLVHGINAPVSALKPGMLVIAHGALRGTRVIAVAARAFTPAKQLTVWTGDVVSVNAGTRQIVVQTAPYQTAVAFLTGSATVNGVRHASFARIGPGSHLTLTGHADKVDSSELLASSVTSR